MLSKRRSHQRASMGINVIINEHWRKMKAEQMNTWRESEWNRFKEQQQQQHRVTGVVPANNRSSHIPASWDISSNPLFHISSICRLSLGIISLFCYSDSRKSAVCAGRQIWNCSSSVCWLLQITGKLSSFHKTAYLKNFLLGCTQ